VNLHAIVRGAIGSVNPDVSASLLVSTGSTVNAAGKRTPTYATGVTVRIQVQPTSGKDVERLAALNIQGIPRTVYMFGNTQGVQRVVAKGGDLLQFSAFKSESVTTWLVVLVDGPWNVEQGGWTKLLVVQQVIGP